MSDLDFESPRRFRASFISGSSAVYFSIFYFFFEFTDFKYFCLLVCIQDGGGGGGGVNIICF